MKTEIDLYVIDKVREYRLKADHTQESLSYALGYSRTFISNFENGSKKFNINQLNKIARVLKCSPKDFLPQDPL
ncbi:MULTISPECIES: helix-turn-helix domain-containing protein [Butyricimonas]|uniref:Helix-turn-helix transcriptional regulator n=1 Tax=Butyricimonas hominis TaxID=2763032 RepID=A0ABR7D3X8_9BACT|nr:MULTISPECIES: helix-turn-helix transcriptional regulator [Butyricimonas]MBC5622633.1 helix-turn-helix transcriptional regulator [Butyricimonas hominis]